MDTPLRIALTLYETGDSEIVLSPFRTAPGLKGEEGCRQSEAGARIEARRAVEA